MNVNNDNVVSEYTSTTLYIIHRMVITQYTYNP